MTDGRKHTYDGIRITDVRMSKNAPQYLKGMEQGEKSR